MTFKLGEGWLLCISNQQLPWASFTLCICMCTVEVSCLESKDAFTGRRRLLDGGGVRCTCLMGALRYRMYSLVVYKCTHIYSLQIYIVVMLKHKGFAVWLSGSLHCRTRSGLFWLFLLSFTNVLDSRASHSMNATKAYSPKGCCLKLYSHLYVSFAIFPKACFDWPAEAVSRQSWEYRLRTPFSTLLQKVLVVGNLN